MFLGEQIFSSYGEQWFIARGIDEYHPRKQLEEEVIRIDPAKLHEHPNRLPGCASMMTKLHLETGASNGSM
jgi:hypothetical protein